MGARHAGRDPGAWILTVAYGATDEWHQMYITGRHAEWRDLAADAVGALVAGMVVSAERHFSGAGHGRRD